MGGPSYEYAVSLKSGEAVRKALKKEGLDVISVVLPRHLPLKAGETCALLKKIISNESINLVFNALHGRFGEDGQLQRILDGLGIPYTGSGARASYLAMDKLASRRIFKKAGISVPRYVVINKLNCKKFPFSFPVVVKPVNGGSSIGVSITEAKKDLDKAVRLALAYDDRVIIEEYIPGREITVGIMEDKPLPVIQVVPKQKFYSYSAKYEDHGTDYLIPAPIPAHLQKRARSQAVKAHKALGCSSFSRIDMILNGEGRAVVLEVNTIPGLTDRSLLPKAARFKNMSFTDVCLKILNSALCNGKENKMRSENSK